MKAAAHERDIGERVEITEHADAVHHDHIAGGRGGIRHGLGQRGERDARGACSLQKRGEMGGGRFVRRDDQTRARGGIAGDNARRDEPHECLEYHGFVGRPSGARHQRGARTGQRLQHRLPAIDTLRAPPHLIKARVTGDLEHLAAHAELHESVRVTLVDGSDALKRVVRVVKQQARQCSQTP